MVLQHGLNRVCCIMVWLQWSGSTVWSHHMAVLFGHGSLVAWSGYAIPAAWLGYSSSLWHDLVMVVLWHGLIVVVLTGACKSKVP